MADDTLSPRLQAVRDPIAGDNPVGEDVRYEDAFQQLKQEVDKVQSATADADFARIVELATGILAERSKDLTVAAYLGLGLVQTDGLAGLAEGAEATRILCEGYWEDLYPPARRMVARKNALQLLIDRAHDWLEAERPKAGDEAPLEKALESYKALQAFAMEKMEQEAPVVSKITRLLEAKIRALPKAAPPGEAAPASPPAAAAEPAGPAELRSPADAAQAVMDAAAFLRHHDKTDPAPFRLARALHWGGLLSAPPAENGQTLIPPYLEQRKTYLEDLLGRAQFSELLDEAEETFHEQPFWLDLQRYAVTAMDALGEPFAAARDGLVEETAGLLRRFPEIPRLAFNDGTPFADAATREWVEVRLKPALTAGAEVPQSEPEEQGALEAHFAEAREHLARGDLAAALAVMREGEGADRSGRDRFRRRLHLASLCLRGGRPALARPLLERLEAEAEALSLETWEPELAFETWSALYACYGALAAGGTADGLPQAGERVFAKICGLDPARALDLDGLQAG